MSVLSEALIGFLLSTLLPWVISLMAAAVDKYLRPYVTQEGFDALTALFQRFLDDAITAGRDTVITFLTGVIGPIFKITLVAPTPVVPPDPMALLAEVAVEMKKKGIDIPEIVGN